ncbi:MAG: histidine phosphatase family protein [Paracoccaceae bacterium]
MSIELILTRHAKSDWDDPAASDHMRPLNARGHGAATALGRWLRIQRWKPEEAMVSNAERTAQTWFYMAAEWESPPQASFMHKLYLASPETLLGAIRQAEKPRLQIIAHNPGIAALAEMLCDTPPDHMRFLDYPTGSTLVLRFDVTRWADLQVHSGQVLAFVTPKDISQ